MYNLNHVPVSRPHWKQRLREVEILNEKDFIHYDKLRVALKVHPTIRDRIMIFKVKCKAKHVGEAINKLIDIQEQMEVKVFPDKCEDGSCNNENYL